MAKETPKPYAMHLDRTMLRALVRTLERSGVTEFEYEDEKIRVRIGRGVPTHMVAAAPAMSVSSASLDDLATASARDEGTFAYVTSPFVGTFYRSPSPDAPSFTDVGAPVKPGQTLCIVEAMKLMNEIEADVAGTLVEVLVENGKSVEYGQKLFKVRTGLVTRQPLSRPRKTCSVRRASMTAVILSIGTELTRGELVNTNAPWLAAQLTELGFDIVAVDTVKDTRADIVAALRRLSATAKVLVVTGGLGPTTDDITSECVAEAMGVKLTRHEASLDAIRRRFEKLGREMSPSNEKQADFPIGADVLPNVNGTAPAFAVFLGDCRAFFMPGVPREMKAIYETLVAPRLRPVAVVDSHQIRLRTFGLPESTVGERLGGLEEANPGLTIGYRASFPEIEVKVHVRAKTGDEARTRASIVADEVRNRLGQYVFGEGDDTFPEAVGRAFRNRGFRLAVAESCTGGLVGHLITSVPAASEYFVADAVTYANSAKTRLLGVNEETLRGHGAVSAEVAAEMAEGIRRVGEVDVGLSITGIAGPTGGSPEKPVGLVYWGVSTARGTVVKSRTLFGDRSMIQRLAAYVGLQLVREAAMLDERSSTHVRVAEPVELVRGFSPISTFTALRSVALRGIRFANSTSGRALDVASATPARVERRPRRNFPD